MSSAAVTVTVEDEIARLRLNQPDRRNAWSPDLLAGLADGLDRVEESDARYPVLEAAGEAFCAGGDDREGVDAFLEGREPEVVGR